MSVSISEDAQPVTQITVIEPDPGKQDQALAVMTERAHFMARQPGFISINLYRSLDGKRIVNHIEWQRRDLLEAAHKSPEFREDWGAFGRITETIDPHLYELAQAVRQQAPSAGSGRTGAQRR